MTLDFNKLIIWALVAALAGFAGVAAWGWYLNNQLDDARQESALIESELQRIKGISEYRRAELERVKSEADQAIQEANARLDELTAGIDNRDELLADLRAENERLRNDLLDTINIPDAEPLPPDELIKQAEQLYFPREFTESESALFPVGLVNAMYQEIEQRRVLDFNNHKIITEQDKQIADLRAAIATHEARFNESQKQYRVQSELVDSLNAELAEYEKLVKSKDREIGILEKQNAIGFKDYLINVGVALAAFEVGRRFE